MDKRVVMMTVAMTMGWAAGAPAQQVPTEGVRDGELQSLEQRLAPVAAKADRIGAHMARVGADLNRVAAQMGARVSRLQSDVSGLSDLSGLSGLSDLSGLSELSGLARLAELAPAGSDVGISGLFSGSVPPRPNPAPPAWIQSDPGDSLYSAARRALNRGRSREAARTFRELRERHPDSGYVPDAYYFEAYALSRVGGSEQLEAALDLLEDQAEQHPDAPTRRDARALRTRIQGALAQQGDADAAAGIASQATSSCADAEDDVRAMALNALLNMNADRAVPILMEVLKSRDECSAELRKKAVFLLSQKMTDETVDIFLDLAHRNPDPSAEVREAAVFWLSQVRSEEATDALESILDTSDDLELQEKAIFALSQRRGDRPRSILRTYAERADAPTELREKAIFWLGQDGGAGLTFLRELYPRLEEIELKEKVVFAVSQSGGEESRTWLLARARDGSEDREVREKALFWLSQAGISGAELGSLYSEFSDRELKEKVIFGLSQLGDGGGVDALMDIARNEDDPKLKEKAIFWLGQSDDPRVTDFLLELINRGGGEA